MKHFRNGYRVCINCFGHVVANTFSGNFRYFIHRNSFYLLQDYLME
ncbi:Uncharacterised protein [Escherichia coli]|nr:Uncharacterised protein [Shigella sonnei]CTU52686.1 Uncharacterised protein [Escherichia coli]SRV96105.1 Uncharacterised protein [Shigella sonnei]